MRSRMAIGMVLGATLLSAPVLGARLEGKLTEERSGERYELRVQTAGGEYRIFPQEMPGFPLAQLQEDAVPGRTLVFYDGKMHCGGNLESFCDENRTCVIPTGYLEIRKE